MCKKGYCMCGCGGLTTQITLTNNKKGRIKGEYNKYILGHHPHTGSFKKSHIPWNKGFSKETDIRIAETSKRMKLNNPAKTLNFKFKMSGQNNPMWKPDVGYNALHAWVSRNKSSRNDCELCHTITRLDLANISQEYKRDVEDYMWLCRRCHMEQDNRMYTRDSDGKFKKKVRE